MPAQSEVTGSGVNARPQGRDWLSLSCQPTPRTFLMRGRIWAECPPGIGSSRSHTKRLLPPTAQRMGELARKGREQRGRWGAGSGSHPPSRARAPSHIPHREKAVPARPLPLRTRHAVLPLSYRLIFSPHVAEELQHLEKQFFAPSPPPPPLTCQQTVRVPTERFQTPFGSQQTKSEMPHSTPKRSLVRLCPRDRGPKCPEAGPSEPKD